MRPTSILRIGTGVILLGAARMAHANPILPEMGGLEFGARGLVFVALFPLIIEYVTLRWMIGRHYASGQFLKTFVVVNLITWPLTEFLSFFIFWLAEILPLAWEPFLYASRARKAGAQIPGLGRRVVAANLVSFVVGIFMWIGVLHWQESEFRERAIRSYPERRAPATPISTPAPNPAR